MAKMHEILAVEGDLKSTLKKIYDECVGTFEKRTEHYSGFVKRLEMFDSARSTEEVTERRELVDTVPNKLNYVANHAIRFIDAHAQKEWTNQQAKADWIFQGVIIVPAAPATFLLSMETELKSLRAVLEKAPTLQPGVEWVQDKDAGSGVYKTAHPQITMKTEKSLKVVSLTKATDKHPETVEKINTDIPVGRYVATGQSGMLTPAQKSALLANVDELIAGAKQARQRANMVELTKVAPGVAIMKAALTGL